MSFDLRPFNSVTAGQIACDGAPYNDRAHNCIPRAFSAAMTMLGYPDVDPELFTNYEYPQGNLSGESMQSAVDFINSHPDIYPNPPSILITSFSLDAVESYGEAGFPMIFTGRVDCATVRFSPFGACEHASLLEAHLPGLPWGAWNSWGGDRQAYSDYELTAADSLAVLQRAVVATLPPLFSTTRRRPLSNYSTPHPIPCPTSPSVEEQKGNFYGRGYHGKPGDLAARRLFLEVKTDEDYTAGAAGSTTVEVIWVQDDFEQAHEPLTPITATLTGTSAQVFSPPSEGGWSWAIHWKSGGRYQARGYEEF